MDVNCLNTDELEPESEDDKLQTLLLTLKLIEEQLKCCDSVNLTKDLLILIDETAHICYTAAGKESANSFDPDYEEELGLVFAKIVRASDVLELDTRRRASFLVSMSQLALYIAVKGRIHNRDILWLLNAFTMMVTALKACRDSDELDRAAVCSQVGESLVCLLQRHRVPACLESSLRRQQESFVVHRTLMLHEAKDSVAMQHLIYEFHRSEMFLVSEEVSETLAVICFNMATAAYENCDYQQAVDFFKLCYSTVRRSKHDLVEELPRCLAWSYYLWDPSAHWTKAVDVMELTDKIAEKLELQLYFAVSASGKGEEFQVWYYAIRFMEFHLQQPYGGERAAQICGWVFSLLYDKGHYDVLLQVLDMFPWHCGAIGPLSDSSGRISSRSRINTSGLAIELSRWLCALYAVNCLIRLGGGRTDDVINVVASVSDWDADYIDSGSCVGIAQLVAVIAKELTETGQREKAIRVYAVLHSYAKKFGLCNERPMVVYNAVTLICQEEKSAEQLQRAAEFFRNAADLPHPVISSLKLYLALVAGEQQGAFELFDQLEVELVNTTTQQEQLMLAGSVLHLCVAESDKLHQPSPVSSKILDLLLCHCSPEQSLKIEWLTQKIKTDFQLGDSAPDRKQLRKHILEAADLIESAHGSSDADRLVPNAVSLSYIAFRLSEDEELAVKKRFQLACVLLKLTYYAASCDPSYCHEFSYAVFHAALLGVRDIGRSASESATYKEKTYNLCLHILHDYVKFKNQNREKELRTIQPELEELLLLYEIHIYIQLRKFPQLNSFLFRLFENTLKNAEVIQAAAEMLLKRDDPTEVIGLFPGHTSVSRSFEDFLFEAAADLPRNYTELGVWCLKTVHSAFSLNRSVPVERVFLLYHRFWVHLSVRNDNDNLFELAGKLIVHLEDINERLPIQEMTWFADSFWNMALRTMMSTDSDQCDKWFDVLRRLLEKSQILKESYMRSFETFDRELRQNL